MSQSVRGVMLCCFASALILSACSYEGRIVRKEFAPSPFYSALGLRGLYRFEVRCRDGQIRRQVVSADVFANYRLGEYFSDRAPSGSSPAPPAEGPHATPPAHFMIALALRPIERYGRRYSSIPTAWVESAPVPSNGRVDGQGGALPAGR